jgi:hypothetical protein
MKKLIIVEALAVASFNCQVPKFGFYSTIIHQWLDAKSNFDGGIKSEPMTTQGLAYLLGATYSIFLFSARYIQEFAVGQRVYSFYKVGLSKSHSTLALTNSCIP